MAKNKSKSTATESRLFVLALGLLVGFVIAFVFLLSRLPVDSIISQYNSTEARGAEMAEMNFDYYSVLQEQQAGRKPAPQQVVAVEPPVVFMEPPREIVPQNLSSSTPQSAEIHSLRQRVETRAAAPATLPVVPVPVPSRPEVRQSAPRPAQPGAQVGIPSQPRAQAQVQTPAQPRVQQQAPVPVQPRAQQPQINPQVPARAPVREILASERSQDSYFVEAGNYRENNEALRAQSTLRSIGLDAFIVVRQDSQGAIGHRVRIGPFFDQARLDATRERLRSSGMTPRLIRVKG